MNSVWLRGRELSKFTSNGRWASIVALLFVFSINAEYRLSIVGLLVHPYLLVLPIAILFSGVKLIYIPSKIYFTLLIFLTFFFFGSLKNNNPLVEISKVTASLFTFIFFCQAIRTEKDFRMIAWSFLAVAVVIGIMGFVTGEDAEIGERLSGINVLEGIGNKNAQSLFTLPGLFFSVYLALYYLTQRKILLVVLLLAGIFFITIQIFLSANRSGWVGLMIIFLTYLAFTGVNIRALLLSSVLVVFAYVAVVNFASDIVERKRTQTLEGYESDEGRKILIVQSLTVGLENPILGVGFDKLAEEMALRLGVNRFGVFRTDTHFLFGYIFGATGIFSLFFFLRFLWQLCQKRIRMKESPAARQAWILVLSFVILFVIRSFFTREILYSPTFIGGLGLVFGYYLMHARNVDVSR